MQRDNSTKKQRRHVSHDSMRFECGMMNDATRIEEAHNMRMRLRGAFTMHYNVASCFSTICWTLNFCDLWQERIICACVEVPKEGSKVDNYKLEHFIIAPLFATWGNVQNLTYLSGGVFNKALDCAHPTFKVKQKHIQDSWSREIFQELGASEQCWSCFLRIWVTLTKLSNSP